MVSFVVIDKLVEEFTWLKELCRMWDIPIKSAGLTMHCIDYIDHNNYREPSLGRYQKEKNGAPFPFNTIWRTFGCTLDGVLVLLEEAWNHDAKP